MKIRISGGSVSRWDWLLIIGAVLSPMTGLRIWKVGPAEVLCLIWALRFIGRTLKRNPVIDFFVLFVPAMAIGQLYCLIVAPEESSRYGLLVWLYLGFIASVLCRELTRRDVKYNEKVFDLICSLAAVWYLLMYLYSLVFSRTFLGAPLWYFSRFSGGGTNPHQVAVLLCGIMFWFAREILHGRKIIRNAVLFGVSLFLELQTRSSTGLAAILLGAAVLVLVLTVYRVRVRRIRIGLIVIEVIAGAAVIALFWDRIFNEIYDWVAEDSNGIGRFQIWSSFRGMMFKSPVFGLGPGQHALTGAGNIKEFHNSYLEIYAAAGIIGVIALVRLTVAYGRSLLFGDPYLLTIMASLYMYGLAGFAFRRLAFWIILVFTMAIGMRSNADVLRRRPGILPRIAEEAQR